MPHALRRFYNPSTQVGEDRRLARLCIIPLRWFDPMPSDAPAIAGAPLPADEKIASKTGLGLALILLSHLILSAWYSVVIPAWEAHDEWPHYRYAAYIAETGRLPDPSRRLTHEFAYDEATQPPLYYLLAAIPMLFVDTEPAYRPVVNPFAGRGTGEGGVNMVVHDWEAESWPWRGVFLALHMGRFVSVLIGTVGLWFTWRVARLLSPTAPNVALAATAIQAWTPQYVFLGAVMTNDILFIVVATALLEALLRLVREGPILRRVAVVGLWLALALLTKYLALALVPAVLVAVLLAWRRRRGAASSLWRGLAVMMLPLLLLVGLWLARNVLWIGRPLPRDPVSQDVLWQSLRTGQLPALDVTAVPAALAYGLRTYWVSFGWGNVGAPVWVDWIWLGLIGVAVPGLVWWWRRTKPGLVLPALAFVAGGFVLALPLLRALLHETTFLPGRYVLSTLPVVAWMLAQGWAAWGGRLSVLTLAPLSLWPLALTVALVPWLLRPAYAPPPSLTAAEVASSPGEAVDIRFGGLARLLRIDLGPQPLAVVGRGLAVTLTWEVLARSQEPYILAIHLLGAGDLSYGSYTAYPGNGNAATNVWQPGTRFRETYWLPVVAGGTTPTAGRLQIAFFRRQEGTDDIVYLPVYDAADRPLGRHAHLGALRIERTPLPTLATPSPPVVRFGEVIALIDTDFPRSALRPGWALPIVLHWQTLTAVSEPLHVSVQLLDAEGRWRAGADGPVSPHLPSHLWRNGDRLTTVRWIECPADLPPGRYRLIVVLYRLRDLGRLEAITPDGSILPDGAWPLGQVIVETDA